MSGHLAAGLTAAVLVCWCVGAYNRLVQLRQACVAAFGELLRALAERNRLVGERLAAAAASPAGEDEADARADTAARQVVEAACAQSRAAADHAAARPAAAAPLASLAMAEQVLRSALAQWTARATVAGEAADVPPQQQAADALAAAVAAIDGAWSAAAERFNAAAVAYNRAARQFPTRIVAWLFGFRPAGTL